MPKLLEFFRKNKSFQRGVSDETALDRKYHTFKSLLAGNNQVLELMTDLERLMYDGRSFTQDEALELTESLVAGVYDLVEDLNALSGGAYPELFDRAESISVEALKLLARRRRFESRRLIFPLEHLSLDNLDEVGGKAANLGEVCNRVGLPTPHGFAVTASAAALFLHHSGVFEHVRRELSATDVEDTGRLEEAAISAQERILAAPMPQELHLALAEAARGMVRSFGPQVRLAVRSSAVCEDSQASFAGQHATVLGVAPQDMERAWREVVASVFSPRAVFYRRTKGYSEEDVMMSVLVLNMVSAKASGVIYTADPNCLDDRDILVSGIWGLGLSVVDGSADTDFWRVRRHDKGLEARQVALKEERIVLLPGGGTMYERVPQELRNMPCLNDGQVARLVEYALRLEEHYGTPLDVEWAMDADNRFVVLQARPLMQANACKLPESCEFVAGYAPLLSGGQSASPGTASGVVHVVQTGYELHGIPQGAILVARQTSPEYVAAMGKVSGIITDMGSVTGHMASVAREFGIPTLVGVGRGTHTLQHGQVVTLDASNQVVYEGRVTEILQERKPVNLMKGSPVYKSLQQALKLIAPLNLVDPETPDFTAAGCQTLHDIIRFAHEMAMRSMFCIADDLDMQEGLAVPLFTGLPLRFLVVDLGGGLLPILSGRMAEVTDITCLPFKALLEGMSHPGVRWTNATEQESSGCDTAVANSVFRSRLPGSGLGGANYAIVSGEYMNIHGRMGHHFATVDSYCGPLLNDNYIMFSFKGGAADAGRRIRRAQLIGETLRWLGFRVVQKGDSIRAEMKKYDQKRIMEKLDMLGRLLGAMRMLDLTISPDAQTEWYVQQFLKGNYTFSPPPEE